MRKSTFCFRAFAWPADFLPFFYWGPGEVGHRASKLTWTSVGNASKKFPTNRGKTMENPRPGRSGLLSATMENFPRGNRRGLQNSNSKKMFYLPRLEKRSRKS